MGPMLGAFGKGIRPALNAWSRKIGLVTESNANAFEPVNRGPEGRGHRMLEVYIEAARSMLG